MTKTVQIDMKRLTRLADKAREVGKLKRRIRELEKIVEKHL